MDSILLDVSSRWEYFRDSATLVITLVGALVAILVYRDQQRQNRQAAEENARQVAKAARLDWIRILVVEPNRDYIQQFFDRVETTLARANHSPLRLEQRQEIANELDMHFSGFSRRILSYFDGTVLVSNSPQYRQLVEDLQENLSIDLDQFNDAEHIASHRKMERHVIECRNNFLNALASI